LHFVDVGKVVEAVQAYIKELKLETNPTDDDNPFQMPVWKNRVGKNPRTKEPMQVTYVLLTEDELRKKV